MKANEIIELLESIQSGLNDLHPTSALAWQLPERHQMPKLIRRRRFPAQDIQIAVIRANFVKGTLSAIPDDQARPRPKSRPFSLIS